VSRLARPATGGEPLRFGGNYQGSSFSELLEVDFAHFRPDLSRYSESDLKALAVPHGTTVLAFKYSDGVVMAGDRLATEGHRVASRDIQKVYATDGHSMVAIAGAAGPAIEMARILRVELEHYEKIEGESLELEGKANKLSQMIRQNLPMAMQGLVVVPLFAGYDLRRHAGRLWKYDVTGGRYEETEFEATGSGGVYASESLKKAYSPGMSRADAVKAAIEALTDAADQDRATGGVDVERGIFPIVGCCSQSGIDNASDSEIREIYQDIMARRRSASEVAS
jgi:proteasome beta subunit